MSLRRIILAASLITIVSAAAPARASAGWLFTPFVGSTFGGNADLGGVGDNFKNEFERKLNYGASIGWMGAGIIGFEADFGYSPNFFRVDDNSSGINLVGDGNVTTLMGNLVVGAPLGPFHPYASGGVGLLKTSVDDAAQFLDASRNDFGYDVGGGLMLGGPISIRGDIRYFRSLHSNDSDSIDFSIGGFRFWRGTVGVTFKF
jgi:hypothetical protein